MDGYDVDVREFFLFFPPFISSLLHSYRSRYQLNDVPW